MEDTLRGLIDTYKTLNDECLNPCFNGRYSQRKTSSELKELSLVLILVLMEDTLREHGEYG